MVELSWFLLIWCGEKKISSSFKKWSIYTKAQSRAFYIKSAFHSLAWRECLRKCLSYWSPWVLLKDGHLYSRASVYILQAFEHFVPLSLGKRTMISSTGTERMLLKIKPRSAKPWRERFRKWVGDVEKKNSRGSDLVKVSLSKRFLWEKNTDALKSRPGLKIYVWKWASSQAVSSQKRTVYAKSAWKIHNHHA